MDGDSKRPWIAAARAFLQAGFRPGAVLTDTWLCEKMGLPGKEKGQRLRRYRERFVLWLMKHHQFAFDRLPAFDAAGNVQDGCLRFVGRLHPLQHLLRRTRELRRQLRRFDQRAAEALACVDWSTLTEKQKQEHQADLAMAAASEGLHLRLRDLRQRIGRDLRSPRSGWEHAFVARMKELIDFIIAFDDTL